jgi:hypothetical protein
MMQIPPNNFKKTFPTINTLNHSKKKSTINPQRRLASKKKNIKKISKNSEYKERKKNLDSNKLLKL